MKAFCLLLTEVKVVLHSVVNILEEVKKKTFKIDKIFDNFKNVIKKEV